MEARNKNTLEYVDAEDLWHITNVDKDGYICIGCSLKAIPCSFNKNLNKKRPYFKFATGIQHDENCFFEKNEKLVKEAKKKKIATKSGFPLAHPNILIFKDDTSEEKTKDKKDKHSIEITKYENEGIKTKTSCSHNYSVNTIASIAKHYLKFPYDRKNMLLKIPNINGSNYDEVIKQLPNEVVEFKEKKLRYGLLNNYKKIIEDNSLLIISTLNGNWIDKKPSELYNIKIDITGWKQSKVDYIKNIIETSQEEYKEKKKTTFIFFIGEQNLNKSNEFIVKNYRFFTCLSKV